MNTTSTPALQGLAAAMLEVAERAFSDDAEDLRSSLCTLLDAHLGLAGTVCIDPGDASTAPDWATGAAARLDADRDHGVVDTPDGPVAVVIRTEAGPVIAGAVPSETGPPAAAELDAAARLTRTLLDITTHVSETRRTQETSERLLGAGIRLASQQTLNEILTGVVEDARTLVNARYAALGVLGPSGDSLERFITSGITAEERRAIGPEPRGRGILGLLLTDPRPQRIADIRTDPRACGMPPNHPPMTSFLGVPILHRGECFGNLYLTDKRDAAEFTDADERIIRTLAAQAAIAIANRRRYEAETQVRHELEIVHEVTGAILATRDLSQLLPLIARRAGELCGADTVAIGMGGEYLRFTVVHGRDVDRLTDTTTPGPPDRCADRLRELVPDAHVHVTPLERDGERIGAVAAVAPGPLDPSEQRVLALFAGQAAIAIANAEAFADERAQLRESARIQAADARATVMAEAMQRAIDAQETERARVARELHDEAGQSLTALALALRMLDENVDEKGRERLAELRQMVNGVSSDLRNLATELRPSGLREHGLASAIERQAARLGAPSGIRIDTVVSGPVETLPDAVQVGLLRVVQEALTNVVRHSHATRASVLVTCGPGHVRTVVEDDGQGFDPDAPTSRLGVMGMRERVEILGGTLRIESAPGKGTTVIADVEGLKP